MLAMALVQIGGGKVVGISTEGPIHFRAEIRGAVYPMHAMLGSPMDDGGWRFEVPDGLEDAFILGIVAIGPTRFRLVELDWDVVQASMPTGSNGEKVVDVNQALATGDFHWGEIQSFAKRL